MVHSCRLLHRHFDGHQYSEKDILLFIGLELELHLPRQYALIAAKFAWENSSKSKDSEVWCWQLDFNRVSTKPAAAHHGISVVLQAVSRSSGPE